MIDQLNTAGAQKNADRIEDKVLASTDVTAAIEIPCTGGPLQGVSELLLVTWERSGDNDIPAFTIDVSFYNSTDNLLIETYTAIDIASVTAGGASVTNLMTEIDTDVLKAADYYTINFDLEHSDDYTIQAYIKKILLG